MGANNNNIELKYFHEQMILLIDFELWISSAKSKQKANSKIQIVLKIKSLIV